MITSLCATRDPMSVSELVFVMAMVDSFLSEILAVWLEPRGRGRVRERSEEVCLVNTV